MNKIYLLYQISTQDFANINDIESALTKNLEINGSFELIGAYNSEQKVLMALENEKKFQCNDDKNWTYDQANCFIDNGVVVTFYYCDEPQYSLIVQEMEVVE